MSCPASHCPTAYDGSGNALPCVHVEIERLTEEWAERVDRLERERDDEATAACVAEARARRLEEMTTSLRTNMERDIAERDATIERLTRERDVALGQRRLALDTAFAAKRDLARAIEMYQRALGDAHAEVVSADEHWQVAHGIEPGADERAMRERWIELLRPDPDLDPTLAERLAAAEKRANDEALYAESRKMISDMKRTIAELHDATVALAMAENDTAEATAYIALTSATDELLGYIGRQRKSAVSE